MKQVTLRMLWLFAIVCCFASCGKKAPTDDQLKDLCRNVNTALKDISETDSTALANVFSEQLKTLGADYDINKITPEQVDMMFEYGGIPLDAPLRSWLSPLLKEKASKDGIAFAYRFWRYYPGANGFQFTDGEIEAYKTFISQPDFSKFATEHPEVMVDVVNGAATISADDWKKFEITPYIKTLLSCPLNEDAAERTVGIFNNAFSSATLTGEEKEEIRLAVLPFYEKIAKETSFSSRKKRAENQISYLNSPFATGKLIGHEAPVLNFDWLSRGNEKTLADFKGKVVMLDFWATKCAPCIELFPEVAALQKHYEGKPVAILGITSAQGYFIDTPNQRTVNTEGNPQKEFALTPSYMKSMGMTWTVAYTKQDVMNPDYGVLAIPHIAIIDKQGRVRYNGITDTNEAKIKLIDELLAE